MFFIWLERNKFSYQVADRTTLLKWCILTESSVLLRGGVFLVEFPTSSFERNVRTAVSFLTMENTNHANGDFPRCMLLKEKKKKYEEKKL